MKILYRDQIIETINKLIESREIIFTQIVNIAMSTEQEFMDKTFDEDALLQYLIQKQKLIDSKIFYI